MAKKVKRRGFADAPHYSTAASKRWWARVNRITSTKHHNLAYGIGCALQEIEMRLLYTLDEIEQRKWEGP